MSQFYISPSASPPPPSALTNITTDVADDTTTGPGTVNVVGNNIELLGRDTSQNNVNGFRTDADPNNGNIVYTELTNRVHGNVQTNDGSTVNVMTFIPPLIAGVYDFSINICAWINATQTASTYQMLGAVKADGVGGLLTIGTPIRTMRGESATFDVTQVDVSVGLSTIFVTVTGINPQTIRWTGVMTYVFGGA